MLSEYYKVPEKIPDSTQKIIKTALFKENVPIKKDFALLYQVVGIIMSIVFLGSSVVYAKNPYNSLTFWFNTENVISKAIENGYNQEIDMDYIYSKNIGIKADSVLISNTAINVDFKYNYNDTNITEVLINEMIIENEKNDKLYNYKREKEENLEIFTEKVKRAYSYVGTNQENIQFFSNDFAEANSLNIKITSLKIKNNNNYKIVNGNWNIKLDLDSNMASRDIEKYNATMNNYKNSEKYNKYVQQADAELNETTMKVTLVLNKEIDENILLNKNNILFSNLNTLKTYNCIYSNIENDNSKTVVELLFDMNKFEENTDSLELSIVISKIDAISINFNK
jgi:hypothetical protein